MLKAFVDESERNEDFYFLGALVCTEEDHANISQALCRVLTKHSRTNPNITQNTEFHAYELMNAKGTWRHIPIRLRLGIYAEALQCIADSQACALIQGINIQAQKQRYHNPWPAREVAFSYLFESINEHAALLDDTVSIVADEHHTSDVSRSNFAKYQEAGTFGYKSSHLERMEPSIDFIDSKTDRALQGADLITYLYNRVTTVREKDERAHNAKMKLWRVIYPSFDIGSHRIWP